MGAAGTGAGTTASAAARPPVVPFKPYKASLGNPYLDRFMALWNDVHNPDNGYFSPQGIPYHAVETLICEAPDYGHETTSEAYSYWIWLEAMYGRLTKDWSYLDGAWSNMEAYAIPSHADQPTNSAYNPQKPGTYAGEHELPSGYPSPLETSVPIGSDPIASELASAYGGPDVYGMHWLIDVDNWYGFGQRGDAKGSPALFNTFQRGVEESVWETVPQPAWDAFQWGGAHGFIDLFVKSSDYARQWKYTVAPDADARAVAAVFWAKKWADESGGSAQVDAVAKKAGKLGDYLRYALFDKYFKKMGCTSTGCAASNDYGSAHYLLSWYYAWGGSLTPANGWAWRIASSHNHAGYQNPLAAYALSADPAMKPASKNGARDWGMSLTRQLEFYRWLQSAEGAIAGGATNSWGGRYAAPPPGTPAFYEMAYDASPVFHDPPSNEWFGFQAWSMDRVAEYHYVTGDPKARIILDKWVSWVKKAVKLDDKGGYQVPSSLDWSGHPSKSWDAKNQNFDGADRAFNADLHVSVRNSGDDPGVAAALARTLSFYAKKTGDKAAQTLAKELLDRMWARYRDAKGVSAPEKHGDYKRFAEKVYVPPGWKGKMPNGDVIDGSATFLSIRSKFKQDPEWPKMQAFLDGGEPPTFHYHRFWAESDVALANATYGWLFP